MTSPVRAIAFAVGLLACSVASADLFYFQTPLGLTGDQEPPPPVRVTPASGYGWVVLDTTALTLSVRMEWEDLLSPPGASHIHVGQGPGTNGPVAIDFVPAAFPNVVTGQYEHTFDLTDAVSYGGGFLASFGGNVDAAREAVIAGLHAGHTYLNIHTPDYPAGEIRGDLAVVPEPATLALVGIGLAAGAWTRRRSRKGA